MVPTDVVILAGARTPMTRYVSAAGTRQILTLLLELRRRNARYGTASACIGGGQGIARLVESPA